MRCSMSSPRPAALTSSIALDARVGGSPLNVAVALSRLGQSTGFLAKVSNDPFGRKLVAYLESERRRYRSAACAPSAPTTLAIVALDDKGVPTYSFYTSGTADRSLEAVGTAGAPARCGARRPYRLLHHGAGADGRQPRGAGDARARRGASSPTIPTSAPRSFRIRSCGARRVAALTAQAHLVKASVEDIQFLYPGAEVERVLAGLAGDAAPASRSPPWARSARMAMTTARRGRRASAPVGQGHRHGRRRRHLPGGLADVAGGAWPPVGGRSRHAFGRRSERASDLRGAGGCHHLLAPRRRHAEARRTVLRSGSALGPRRASYRSP